LQARFADAKHRPIEPRIEHRVRRLFQFDDPTAEIKTPLVFVRVECQRRRHRQ
jgi:hypothetical protein